MSNKDFADYLESEGAQGGGILDSMGLRDHYGLETSVVREGVRILLNCQECNRKKEVIAEWPEIIVIAENGPQLAPLVPQGWEFSPRTGSVQVSMPCRDCHSPNGVSVGITPQEAQRYIASGLQAGFVTPQQVQQIRANMQQARGGR